jgi:acetyltransferase (GNAT) family protein
MTDRIVVEPLAGSADLDGVLAIEEASFNNPTTRTWYEAELARPDVCKVFVIRTPERPVAGFAAFWKVVDEMHINNLAVHPECRGQGLCDGGTSRDTRSPPLECRGAAAVRRSRLSRHRDAPRLLHGTDRGCARAQHSRS